jgi:hypothetical protein
VSRFLFPPTTSGSRTKFYSSVALFAFALLAHSKYQNSCLATIGPPRIHPYGIAGLAFAVRILNNWRHGLYIFFGWLFRGFRTQVPRQQHGHILRQGYLVILVYISFNLARRNSGKKSGSVRRSWCRF